MKRRQFLKGILGVAGATVTGCSLPAIAKEVSREPKGHWVSGKELPNGQFEAIWSEPLLDKFAKDAGASMAKKTDDMIACSFDLADQPDTTAVAIWKDGGLVSL